jgi:hypothetical protein
MTIRKVEKADWKPYLDHVSRRIGGHRYAKIETASPRFGVEIQASAAFLQGIAYDTANDMISFFCEGLDHIARSPKDLYVDDLLGDPSSLAVMNDDGSLQIVTFRPLLALPAPEPGRNMQPPKEKSNGRTAI